MAQNILKIHGYEEIQKDRLDLIRAVERTLAGGLKHGIACKSHFLVQWYDETFKFFFFKILRLELQQNESSFL